MKKGDVVRVEMTGRRKATNQVFETTDETVAKNAGIYSEERKYGPALMIVGEGMALRGIEEVLEELDVGVEKEITLPPEKAFGERRADLIRIVPVSDLKKHDIPPVPGVPVLIDGRLPGVIKTVTSGRAVIDFNHPLAGQDVVYTLKIIEKIEKDEDKVRAIVDYRYKDPVVESVSIENGTITVTTKKDVLLQPRDKSEIADRVFGILPAHTITFVESLRKVEKKEKEQESASPSEQKS